MFPQPTMGASEIYGKCKTGKSKITPRGFPDVSLVTRIFSIKQSNELVLLAVS